MMVTEVLVWAMILTNHQNRIIEIYNTELVCRQDMREARRAVPEAELKCVPRHSIERPGGRMAGSSDGP
jgi:hypothetical protein